MRRRVPAGVPAYWRVVARMAPAQFRVSPAVGRRKPKRYPFSGSAHAAAQLRTGQRRQPLTTFYPVFKPLKISNQIRASEPRIHRLMRSSRHDYRTRRRGREPSQGSPRSPRPPAPWPMIEPWGILSGVKKFRPARESAHSTFSATTEAVSIIFGRSSVSASTVELAPLAAMIRNSFANFATFALLPLSCRFLLRYARSNPSINMRIPRMYF